MGRDINMTMSPGAKALGDSLHASAAGVCVEGAEEW